MNDLIEWAARKGYKIGFGNLSVFDGIKSEMMERREAGEIHPAHRYFLTERPYLDGVTLRNIRSVLVIAVPQPACRVTFHIDGRPLVTRVAPGYLSRNSMEKRLYDELKELLGGKGHSIEPVTAPMKNLAVRIGLAEYGINNLTYVPDLGTYHRLVGFVTDLECPEGLQAAAGHCNVSAVCRDCLICRKACPTGVLCDHRFMVDIDRCITSYHYKDGEWPDWLPEDAHNSLYGCMVCQEVCPRNKGLLTYSEDNAALSFTAEETAFILSDNPQKDSQVWNGIMSKFELMELPDYDRGPLWQLIGRNLRALVNREAAGG